MSNPIDFKNLISNEIEDNLSTIKLLYNFNQEIEFISQKIIKLLKRKNKLLICGNGGSSSDANHLSSELVGKFEKSRRSYPAISLSSDTSALTAIGNDYGFDKIFSRQIEGLAQEGDLLLVISTSGNSENLISAVKKAKEIKIESFGLLGKGGGNLKKLVDNHIIIRSEKTSRIQEAHGLVIHILCKIIDDLM